MRPPAAADDLRAAPFEVPRPPRGVEPDDVVREQPFVHRPSHCLRQDRPVDGPRDVDEVRELGVGACGTHAAGREVQVVVLEENGCARSVVQFDNDPFGEQAVDGLV